MKFRFGKVLALISVAILLSACSGAAASGWPATTEKNGDIYLSSGQSLFVVNSATGVESTISTADGMKPARLPFNASGAVNFFAPALSDGETVVIGNAATKNNELYAVDKATGNIKWMFEGASAPWIAGVYAEGSTIFAPAGDGNLYLLDAANGTLIGDPIKLSEHSLWTTPVSDGSLIFIESMEHDVYAFDGAGKTVWKTGLDSSIIGPPLAHDGSLYVGTLSGMIYSLNAADGSKNWEMKLNGNVWGTPATDGEAIYIGTVTNKTGKFYSLSMSDGSINWQREEEGSVIAGPTVANGDVIYVTEAGKLQVITNAGTPKWQAIIENAKYYTTPLAVDGLIVVAPMNSDYLLVAYDLQGAQKWTFTGK